MDPHLTITILLFTTTLQLLTPIYACQNNDPHKYVLLYTAENMLLPLSVHSIENTSNYHNSAQQPNEQLMGN